MTARRNENALSDSRCLARSPLDGSGSTGAHRMDIAESSADRWPECFLIVRPLGDRNMYLDGFRFPCFPFPRGFAALDLCMTWTRGAFKSLPFAGKAMHRAAEINPRTRSLVGFLYGLQGASTRPFCSPLNNRK